MKIEAISILERASIIRHLSEHGKWEATRLGAQVSIYRFTTPGAKNEIQYWVGQGTRNTHGQSRTVGDAVAEVNKLIAGRPDPPRVQVPPSRSTRPAAPEWLPYKDA